MFSWEKGRQGSGYDKMCLFSFWFIDLYILKYDEGSYIDWHIDPVKKGYSHHRLNIVIKNAKEGGVQCYDSRYSMCLLNRVILFRPDLGYHSVSEIVKGKRIVLSLGWLRKCL